MSLKDVSDTDLLLEFEKRMNKWFEDMDKPKEEIVNILGKDNPQEWRDKYFFNNGVKAIMTEMRPSYQANLRRLLIAAKALDKISKVSKINPQRHAYVALENVRKVKDEDFK